MSKLNFIRVFFYSAVIMIFIVSFGYAQIPRTLSYQGVLTDANGIVVPDGNYMLTFKLYDNLNGGAPLWVEEQEVAVNKGVLSVILGSINPLKLAFDRPYYLEVQVNSEMPLSPRIPLTSTAYSFISSSVEDNVITTSKIVDGSVTKSKLSASGGSNGQVLKLYNDNLIWDTDKTGNLILPYSDSIASGESVFSITNSSSGPTIEGRNVGSNVGVLGYSSDNTGVLGSTKASKNYGVSGMNIKSLNIGSLGGSNDGVFGVANSQNGNGVYGVANNGYVATGVYGESSTGYGVYGIGKKSGVEGITSSIEGYGVTGVDVSIVNFGYLGGQDKAVYGVTTLNSGYGVYGVSNKGTGVYGKSIYGIGVWGVCDSGKAVYGRSFTDYAVHGLSYTGSAIYGETVSGPAAFSGWHHSSGNKGSIATKDYGVEVYSSNGIAVFAFRLNGGNYAGYFYGNVLVTGTLSKAAGSFKIDHPLDPANKYLCHSFVESPDMMNIYNGNVVLDTNGEAWVNLPAYFEALNKDFTYQLTAIGAPAPNLYISQKISGNRFKISGGKPGMEVSWQVTGVRQDAFAEKNRIQVEVEKTGKERGKYLHPKEYGVSETLGINYEESQKIQAELKRLQSEGQKIKEEFEK